MPLPDGVTIDITPSLLEDLTFGELEQLDELAGDGALDDITEGRAKPRTMTALAYIVLRRQYPDVTIEDVRALKLRAFRVAPDANPTDAGA